MLCCAVSYAVLCCAMLSFYCGCALQCSDVLGCVLCTLQCCPVLSLLCDTVFVLRYVVLCYAVFLLYVLFCVCAMLNFCSGCAVLCCVVLCCAVQ